MHLGNGGGRAIKARQKGLPSGVMGSWVGIHECPLRVRPFGPWAGSPDLAHGNAVAPRPSEGTRPAARRLGLPSPGSRAPAQCVQDGRDVRHHNP